MSVSVIVGSVLLLQSRADSTRSPPATWLMLTPISSSSFHSTPSHFHCTHLPQRFYVFSFILSFVTHIANTINVFFCFHVALKLASIHSFSLLFCQPPSSVFYHPLLIPCVVQRQGKFVHIAFALLLSSSHTWLHVDLTNNQGP